MRIRGTARHVPIRTRRFVPTAQPIISPSIWGPPLWRLLHGLAAAAVPQADEAWPALLVALRTALPCPDCTRHYTAWHDTHPFVGGESPAAWVLALHNDVNRRKQVPEWTPEMVAAAAAAAPPLADALAAVRGKVGEAACTLLAEMIGRLPLPSA